VLATLTEFTARSVALNYRLHLATVPEEIVLTGGGAANPVLVASIARSVRELASAARVLTSEALGWPLASIEPAAFALLAWLRRNGVAGNLPATTGARRAALLGVIGE
jgi:anhydro-N-acetylmuramic acid kinase